LGKSDKEQQGTTGAMKDKGEDVDITSQRVLKSQQGIFKKLIVTFASCGHRLCSENKVKCGLVTLPLVIPQTEQAISMTL
jgi:hypothetical protein